MKFTQNEAKTVRLIQEIRKRPSTPERRSKIRSLKRTLRRYRAGIRTAATVPGGGGWNKANRRWRYQALINVYNDDSLPDTPEAIDKDIGLAALAAAHTLLNKHEVGYNDAPWLRHMEDQLPHDRLDWMIPGQSYCGFGCIWSYWRGAKVLLPDGTVYTPNVCPYGGSTKQTLPDKDRVKFVRTTPEGAKPGALVVFNFGSGGAKHIGLARGAMRGGVMPTREFNTAPGSGGNQANGGGVYDRNRSRVLILCVLNVERA